MGYSITIRHTALSDLDRVMEIYDGARVRMRQAGNTTQWVNGYPSRRVISDDIASGSSYVVETQGEIVGVFTFFIGEEPNYAEIDGAWPNDNPYGTIHRIASSGDLKGIADHCLAYCKTKGVAIRIDTHRDNAPMLGWIAKHGFTRCGVIRVEDGTPRIAFQLDTFSR